MYLCILTGESACEATKQFRKIIGKSDSAPNMSKSLEEISCAICITYFSTAPYEEMMSRGTHYIEVALNEAPLSIRKGKCIPKCGGECGCA